MPQRFYGSSRDGEVMLVTILIIAVGLLLIVAVPFRAERPAFGAEPSGTAGAILAVLLLLTASLNL